jgi:hypothetical protein
MMQFCPETPRFLNTVGSRTKAMLILKKMADENGVAMPQGQLLPQPKASDSIA